MSEDSPTSRTGAVAILALCAAFFAVVVWMAASTRETADLYMSDGKDRAAAVTVASADPPPSRPHAAR